MEDVMVRGNLRAAADRLGRSHSAVMHAASRWGLAWGAADGRLSAREVARKYRSSRRRVAALIASGRLAATKVGAFWRIDPADAHRARVALRENSKYARRGWRR